MGGTYHAGCSSPGGKNLLHKNNKAAKLSTKHGHTSGFLGPRGNDALAPTLFENSTLRACRELAAQRAKVAGCTALRGERAPLVDCGNIGHSVMRNPRRQAQRRSNATQDLRAAQWCVVPWDPLATKVIPGEFLGNTFASTLLFLSKRRAKTNRSQQWQKD
jgi:hypothetical protein